MMVFRHCKNCRHCITDMNALFSVGLLIEKCGIKGHIIREPFWQGLCCDKYERRNRP